MTNIVCKHCGSRVDRNRTNNLNGIRPRGSEPVDVFKCGRCSYKMDVDTLECCQRREQQLLEKLKHHEKQYTTPAPSMPKYAAISSPYLHHRGKSMYIIAELVNDAGGERWVPIEVFGSFSDYDVANTLAEKVAEGYSPLRPAGQFINMR